MYSSMNDNSVVKVAEYAETAYKGKADPYYRENILPSVQWPEVTITLHIHDFGSGVGGLLSKTIHKHEKTVY